MAELRTNRPSVSPPSLGSLPPGWTASGSLAASILLWFDLLALVIGVAQFAVARRSITHSVAAIVALVILLSIAATVRVIPRIRKSLVQRCAWDTFALFAMTAIFTYATGGAHSPLLTLFLLPLTGAAIALGRLGYGIVAVAVVGAAIVLGTTTPDVEIQSSSFAVWLISTLVPAIIATSAIAALVEQMQGAERYIQDLSATDRLTGLLNKRAFEEVLLREHRKAERNSKPYCVVIIDVENFKQTNESLGQDAGNQLLIAVAAAISRSIRATDMAARFGGDEFAVLLTDTDVASATTVGQRIRSHVYSGTISVANRMIRANVHLGLAGFPKDKQQAKDLLQLADQRMQHDREVSRTSGK